MPRFIRNHKDVTNRFQNNEETEPLVYDRTGKLIQSLKVSQYRHSHNRFQLLSICESADSDFQQSRVEIELNVWKAALVESSFSWGIWVGENNLLKRRLDVTMKNAEKIWLGEMYNER